MLSNDHTTEIWRRSSISKVLFLKWLVATYSFKITNLDKEQNDSV